MARMRTIGVNNTQYNASLGRPASPAPDYMSSRMQVMQAGQLNMQVGSPVVRYQCCAPSCAAPNQAIQDCGDGVDC